MIVIPTEQEIRTTLFSMKKLRSPGPDVLFANFFQAHWDLVKHKVVLFIQEIFRTSTFSKALNALLILFSFQQNLRHLQIFDQLVLQTPYISWSQKLSVNVLNLSWIWIFHFTKMHFLRGDLPLTT